MDPPVTDPLRYGEYLAQTGNGMDFHTPRDEKGALIACKRSLKPLAWTARS